MGLGGQDLRRARGGARGQKPIRSRQPGGRAAAPHQRLVGTLQGLGRRRVEVSFELTEIDRRRLTFETRVTCGDRVLSEGTHQRAVIDTNRFG